MSVAQQLRQAIEDTTTRGLRQSAKWAAQHLQSFDTMTEDIPQYYSHNHLYAKSLFDCQEYRQCAHELQNTTDDASRFLGLYATFLYLDSENAMGNSCKNTKELRKLAIKLDKESYKDPFLYYLTGIVYLQLGDLPTAQKWLVSAVTNYPMLWSAWNALATTIQSKSEVDELLSNVPDSFASDCFRIHVFNELQLDVDTVLPIIEELSGTLPNNTFLQMNRAILYHNNRDFEESQALFERLHKDNPFMIDSMDIYSNVLYVRREYTKLCELAQTLTITNKYRPETQTAVGNYHSIKGDRAQAIKSFERALLLDSQYSPAWTLLGHEHVDSCNPKAAVEVYRQAVEINPKDYRAWYGLGQAYDLLSLPSYSIYYHQRALAIRPNDGRMWGALSGSLEAVGRLDEAIIALKRVLVCADIIEPLEYARLAQLYYKLGIEKSAAESEAAFQKAAGFYIKYLDEQDSAEDDQGEFVKDAIGFLVQYYGDRGDTASVQRYQNMQRIK